MSEKFHKRFNILLSEEETQRRFVNRIHNQVWNDFINQGLKDLPRFKIHETIVSLLGEKNEKYPAVTSLIANNFLRNLEAIEVLYHLLSGHNEPEQLDYLVTTIIGQSEIDLGIRWENGWFYPSGSMLLDEKTINDVLGVLHDPSYAGAAQAFHKGLDHFLHSIKKPELLSDVITDMYEALEATAKIICGNDKDLSANREAMISRSNLSDYYKRLLKEYIEYANDFRHAAEKGKPKSLPSRREVEAFIYLTGIFIRLALSKET
ncbi:MAG: hypothetical protein ACREIJ_06820 [Nitrospiraceae bacterium]